MCFVADKNCWLHKLASPNKADVVCVTESWLSPHIDDSLVALPGYNLIRRDRESGSGRGGVCLYLRTSYPCKMLVNCEDRNIESLWMMLRPCSLPRSVSCIILCVIYQSTANGEIENAALRDHVQTNLDTLLVKHPNALAIITGDFNPTSTGFNVKDLTHANNIKQMVKFKTRDSGTLDWFLTNMPNLFDLSQLPKIGASDHFTILARPVTPSLNSRTNRKVRVRDMRESAWRPFGRWMLEKDWTHVLEAASCKEKFQLFSSELKGAIELLLPWRTVKINSSDRPWITG